MGIVLLILLLLLLVGAWPSWPYAQQWGYGYAPSGLAFVLLVLLLMLIIMEHVPWGRFP